MWIWDLYKAMRSGAAGIKPLKVVARTPSLNPFNRGAAVIEEDGPGPAPAPAPAAPTPAPTAARGNRWFETLRLPFGRRLQAETRVMQAQQYPCSRSKVTF